MNIELIDNIDKIHTTPMGKDRIRNNLELNDIDVVDYCKTKIMDQNAIITKKGKNWYVSTDGCMITVNVRSYTIITAHKER